MYETSLEETQLRAMKKQYAGDEKQVQGIQEKLH